MTHLRCWRIFVVVLAVNITTAEFDAWASVYLSTLVGLPMPSFGPSDFRITEQGPSTHGDDFTKNWVYSGLNA